MYKVFIIAFLLSPAYLFAQKNKTYTSLSDAWSNPGNVFKLDLSKKNLNSIPREVFYMTNLEELYLEKNNIVKIPKDIGLLTKLKILDLDQNKIDSVPADIGKLVLLEELDLDQNQLVYLPTEIGQLKNLKSLDLHQNQLTSLPAEIGKIDSLSDLKIYSNKLESLPDGFYNLTLLKQLNLDKNLITGISPLIGNMQNLESFSAVQNQITSIPEEIKECKKITTINLSINLLKTIPSGISTIPELIQLNLMNNQIDTLPDNFGSSGKLRFILLANNQLKHLPKNLQLPHLETLYLKNNQLIDLPENLSGISGLENLDISQNKISDVKSIATLTSLKVLDVSDNLIKLVPEEITTLDSLLHLDLKNNLLEKLPSGIGNLRSLIVLDLYENAFKKQLSGIEKLQYLEFLSIYESQLKYLPKAIEKIEHLDQICINMAGDNCVNSLMNGDRNKEPEYIDEPETIDKIDLSKTGWINYLVKNISTGANYEDEKYKDEPAYELYRQLKYAATNDDLIKLLEHDDATVRIYAFQILDERRYPGIFDFIKKHLDDIKEETSHNNWNYDVNLGSYYVHAISLTPKQRFEIDSLILFSAGFYEESKSILTTYDTVTTFHDGITKLAEKNNEAAIYLAQYRRKSDIPQLQKLLYNNPHYLGGIADIFPDKAFMETLEKICDDQRYSLHQFYSLMNYKGKKGIEILNKMIEKELSAGSKKTVNLEYVMRHIADKKDPYFDSTYLNLWKGVMIYPDTVILERLYLESPDTILETLKKVILKNLSTYEDKKVKYCLNFLYQKKPVWAIPHCKNTIRNYVKIFKPYDYYSNGSYYTDFVWKTPNTEFGKMLLDIYDSIPRSFISPEKLTDYILNLNDVALNNRLLHSIVNTPNISWKADEIKTMLKEKNLLDDIVLLQKKRTATLQGVWKIKQWKYGNTVKKSPSWASMEIGMTGRYQTVTCVSHSIGYYHYDTVTISFDSLTETHMNWGDSYVDINSQYIYYPSMLATSAVPPLINICRDTTFSDSAVVQYLSDMSKIINGELKYELTDSTLHLKGNGEVWLKLSFNYLTNWSTPVPPPSDYSLDYNEYKPKTFYLSNPPVSIAGIPIEKYLARNDIDSLSKLFIQGKYGLKSESYDDNRYLLDSIYTDNPETKAFYFYMINRIMGMAKIHFDYYSQLSSDLSHHCSHFLLHDPCYFFQMVKSGPYSYNYMEWKKYFDRGLWYSEIETLQKKGTEYRIKNDCSKYLQEFKNIVKWMETYDDPDAPPYDGH